MRWIRYALIAVVLVVAGFALLLYARYGGGRDFPDRSTQPVIDASQVEVVAALDDAPGNVAVSADGRVFITLHPEAKPEVNHVVELVDGVAVPFPSAEAQTSLYIAPQG